MTDALNEGNPTTAESGNTDQPTGNASTPGPIPYERFKAVIDERNAVKARLETLEQQSREYESMKQELAVERAAATRARVAAELHLSPALANRLQGTTEDELRADAQALLDALPTPRAPNIDSERVNYNPHIGKRYDQYTHDELQNPYETDPQTFQEVMRATRR